MIGDHDRGAVGAQQLAAADLKREHAQPRQEAHVMLPCQVNDALGHPLPPAGPSDEEDVDGRKDDQREDHAPETEGHECEAGPHQPPNVVQPVAYSHR